MFVAKEPDGSWTMNAGAGLVIYSGLFILSHNNTIKSAGLFITNRTEGISGQVLHQLCAEWHYL